MKIKAMEIMKNERKQRREMAIKNAILIWSEMKNGIYHWSWKERYTPEYCEKQIQYFKNLK